MSHWNSGLTAAKSLLRYVFRMSHRRRYRIALLACFLLGLVLRSVVGPKLGALIPGELGAMILDMAGKAGDALMLAPILAILVEITAAKELLSTFAENVSHHIIGRFLPRPLREHIFKYLTIDFVRRRWEVSYVIDDSQCAPGFIQLISWSSSEIENVSSTSETFNCETEAETRNTCLRSSPIVRQVKVVEGEQVRMEYRFEERGEPDEHLGLTPDSDFLKFKEGISVAPGAIIRQEVETVECFPHRYEAWWVSLWPTLELAVRVLYPKDRFEADLYLSFADHKRAIKTETENGAQWNIKVPMLLGQGFSIAWHRIGSVGAMCSLSDTDTVAARPSHARNCLDT